MSDASKPVNLANGLSAECAVKRDLHPVWYKPTAATQGPVSLRVLNSLTDTTEPFAPVDGRTVKWYTCGPTVYDVSHMGHARCYLTFDILRRVMEDYFGYQVVYQMNITDIDDKIIKRARINKLLEDFKAETKGSFEELVATVAKALPFAQSVMAKRAEELALPLPATASSRVREERKVKLEELALKQRQLSSTAEEIEKAKAGTNAKALFDAAKSIIGDYLDSQKGGSVIDQSIFDAHARKYEKTFFEDCERLGIRPPDVVSRVTEVVPQVVEFVQRIIDNGFAYAAETSVFFDTEAYKKSGHNYPKLKPTEDKQEETTADEMAEGEGQLSATKAGEKRSPNDFALWKFSKPGEPRWPSPWGDGRPGWHIECSVMASGVLGDNMDIHAGGCDLRFPHHDNELAQSEAYWGHHQWVNYFFHCGHLHIEGLKMSKSLKNFITIRQALDDLKLQPREMRVLFLCTDWEKDMNFSDQTIGAAREQLRVLRAFFGSVEILQRKDFLAAPQGYTEEDNALFKEWRTAESNAHAALCDNFGTRAAFSAIMALVTYTNQYLLRHQKDARPNVTLVLKVARFVTRLLKVFGVAQGADEIGFGDTGSSDSRADKAVDALVRFRDEVRKAAREKQPPTAFLPLCDAVRDDYLPPAGIRLEDKPDGSPTQWKFDDPVALVREIQLQREQVAEAKRLKLRNAIEKAEKVVEKWEPFSVSAADLHRRGPESKNYGSYDSEGIPLTDASGAALPEKQIAKLRSGSQRHAKGVEEFNAKGGAEFLQKTKDEVAALKAQLAAC